MRQPRTRPRPPDIDATVPRRAHPAGGVLAAGLVGLLLASVLNARSLADIAQRQEEGPVRRVAVALTRPLADLTSALWLDKPRAAVDRLLGRRPARVRAIRRPDPPPRDTAAPAATRPDVDIPPTARDPAQAWIIGDSFVELFGPKLSDELAESGVVEPEVDFEFTSGLMRPDFVDWPDRISRRMRDDPPDMIVVMFGGNDGQSVTVEGVPYERYTESWWDLYRGRVEEAMDMMRGDLLAYWVGLPVMKDPVFSEHAREFNEVYEAAAEERPWMRYVSSWEVFTDRQGRYADYLPNRRGVLRLMRYEDGAHFTPNGALRLAEHVWAIIAKEWRIPDDG